MITRYAAVFRSISIISFLSSRRATRAGYLTRSPRLVKQRLLTLRGSAARSALLSKARAPRKNVRRLLLIALSPARERMLLSDPELVNELVEARQTTAIPGALEFDERWIDLQRALFDFLWEYGADDERAEALAPRKGKSLYDDEVVDVARLVPAEQAGRIARWVNELPPDMLARAERRASPSPGSKSLPQKVAAEGILKRSSSLAALAPELERLKAFYAELLKTGRAVLSIQFRE